MSTCPKTYGLDVHGHISNKLASLFCNDINARRVDLIN